MTVVFDGADLVVHFKENPLNGAEHLYHIQYTCATTTVDHYVDQADNQDTDSDGMRTYKDVLTFTENKAAGLTRTPVIKMRTQDASGVWSSFLEVDAQNPLPVLPIAPHITPTLDGINVNIRIPDDGDIKGYCAWVGSDETVALTDDNLRYNGPANSFSIQLPDDSAYYLVIAPYDAFGLDTFSAWSAIEVQRKTLDGDITGSQAWNQLPDIINAALQEPIDNIAALQLEYGTSLLKASKALADGNSVAIRDLKTYVDVKTGAVTAEDILQLTTRVDDNESGLSLLNQTYATDKAAQSQQNLLLIAKTNDNASAISTEKTARTDADSALSQQLTQMDTRVGDAEGEITTLQQLINNGDGDDLATQITNLGVKIDTETSDREAAISTETTARIAGDTATGERIDTLTTTVNGNSSALQTLQTTVSNNETTQGQQITTLQSRLDDNGNGASLEQNMTTLANINGQLESAYSLKVQTETDGTKVVAGMELLANEAESAVVFLADSFSIYTPNSSKQIFEADANGVTMSDVTVDTIKADTIETQHIKGGGMVVGMWYWQATDKFITTTETTLIETPLFSLGDTEYGVGFANVTYLQDGTYDFDSGHMVRAYVDYGDGNGYVLYRYQQQGIDTNNGNTYWIIPVSFPIPIVSNHQVKIKITAQAANTNGHGTLHSSYARGIEVDVITGAR